MTNDERFELMWTHYHRQLDENRAVSKHMDEVREGLHDLGHRINSIANFLHNTEQKEEEKPQNIEQEILNKIHKMSFMMGKLSIGLEMVIEQGGLTMSACSTLTMMRDDLINFIEKEFYGLEKEEVNDFTKEELEELLLTMDNTREFTCMVNFNEKLYRKIQSLIDNYCEHERDEGCPPQLSHFTVEKGCIFLYKCKKCEEYFK